MLIAAGELLARGIGLRVDLAVRDTRFLIHASLKAISREIHRENLYRMSRMSSGQQSHYQSALHREKTALELVREAKERLNKPWESST